MDERLVEATVTERKHVIVPVHYVGLGCAMDPIMDIATRHGLIVVEDAAQARLSHQGSRALGTIGPVTCLCFHKTKNIISGEGGALIINDPTLIERTEILSEKGTDPSRFFCG
jgi:dTDP-4-amino-4,6-dideoxygalactose transaminase